MALSPFRLASPSISITLHDDFDGTGEFFDGRTLLPDPLQRKRSASLPDMSAFAVSCTPSPPAFSARLRIASRELAISGIWDAIL